MIFYKHGGNNIHNSSLYYDHFILGFQVFQIDYWKLQLRKLTFAQVKIQDKRYKNQVEMINHVVLFKLKDYLPKEKSGIIAEMKSLLQGLNGKIEELKYIEVGVNYELNSKSYDIVLISHFDSLEDLNKYRIHPEHKKVLARFSELRLERAAVDYEF